MTIIQSLLLGILQGLAEFLPISSSGHLLLMQNYFGIKIDDTQILFDLILHIGTLLSILVFFSKDIIAFLKNRVNIIFLILSIIATMCLASILSLAKNLFVLVLFIAIMLFINGCFLIIGHMISKKSKAMEIDWKKAVWIGVAQGIAFIPGISRSGSTITMAMVLGISKEQAFKYSFFLAIPTIILAFVYESMHVGASFFSNGVGAVCVGFISSFIFGIISLWILKRLILASKFYYFGIYCIVAGLAVFFAHCFI